MTEAAAAAVWVLQDQEPVAPAPAAWAPVWAVAAQAAEEPAATTPVVVAAATGVVAAAAGTLTI